MRFLLDTHVWIWSVGKRHQVASHVLSLLDDPSNDVCLSPINVWEVLYLEKRKRIALSSDPTAWVSKARRGLDEAPLSYEVAVMAAQMDWDHRDPADRFLAATAAVYDLTLVTADRELLALKSISTLSSR